MDSDFTPFMQPEVDAGVRRAAYIVRDALAEHGLASVPVATGSKGYHVVSAPPPGVKVTINLTGFDG